MTDAVHSGYKAAAQTVTWASGRSLVSLADTEWTDLSDEIDNSYYKYLFADLEVVLGSAAFTGTNSFIAIYLVPSIDDTNFPDWVGDGLTDEQENEVHYIGSVTTSGTEAAQRLALRSVSLPPGKFCFAVRNKSNVGLAPSGSSLKWRPWNWASQ